MKSIKIAILMALLLISLALNGAESKVTIDRTFEVGASGSLNVSNLNGFIRISTHKQDRIVVKAVKEAPVEADLELVEVKFFQEGQDVRIEVEHQRNRRNQAKVNFTITLPEGLKKTRARSVNGQIDVSGKLRELDLDTVNGQVKMRGEGEGGALRTVNGSIDLSLEKPLGGDLEVKTVNGAVKIEFNRASAFELEAKTVNGSIRNDFGLNVERGFVGSKVSGQVNDGKHRVRVNTINGSIEIRRIK